VFRVQSGRVTGSPSEDGTFLLGERNVLERIATGAALTEVLDELCRVIDERTGLACEARSISWNR